MSCSSIKDNALQTNIYSLDKLLGITSMELEAPTLSPLRNFRFSKF